MKLYPLGQRLRTLRHQAQFTQRVAAQKLGIDFTFLSKIENDKLSPSWETLSAMLSLYGEKERTEWAFMHLMKTKAEQLGLAIRFSDRQK